MNWKEAKEFCFELSAEMVVLESEEEIEEVAKMTAHLVKKKWRFWVDVEWVNGTLKTYPTFTPWGRSPGHGNCIRSGGNSKWYVSPCETKLLPWGYTVNPFCKKPLEAAATGRWIFK